MIGTTVSVLQDVYAVGDSATAAVLENAPFAVVAAGLIVAGVWLDRSGLDDGAVRRVGVRTALGAAVVGIAFGWLVISQQFVRGRVQPVALAWHTVAVGAVAAFAIGVYRARLADRRAALSAERDRFAALFENVPISVLAVRGADDGARIVAANPAFESVFGYGEGAVRDRRVDDVLVPAGDDRSAVGPASPDSLRHERGEWTGREVTLETETGLRTFLCATVPVDAGDVAGYLLYVDVTDREQRKERLRVLSRVLRHNIRNKLTVIRGHAERLATGSVPPADREDVAGAVLTAADDLHGVSERARSVEATIAEHQPTRTVDLAAVAREAAAEVRAEFPSATLETALPSTAPVDATSALVTAVEECLRNAVAHDDDAAPSLGSVSTSPTTATTNSGSRTTAPGSRTRSGATSSPAPTGRS
ncbi:PAS domain S-box protein [Halobaculum litoreum]|uniref:PAS domain S-box protein n=1 Tax=Halobaculum litoreum TaxID=3031998 RepID=A0ABD5XV66_9EURY